MDDLQVVNSVGTNMFIAFTVMAAAYWIDATRWSKHAQELPPGPAKERAKSVRRTAEILFQCSIGCMIAAILCMVLPLYLQFPVLVAVCKYVILVLLLVLVVICVRYVMKVYFVPIDLNQPEETSVSDPEPAAPADGGRADRPEAPARGG